MRSSKSIPVADILQTQTALVRGMAESLRQHFEVLDRSHQYTLDMKDVVAVSRAFAHELLVIIEDMRCRGVELQLANTAPHLVAIFEAVGSNEHGWEELIPRPDLLPHRISPDEVANFLCDEEIRPS